MIRFMMELVLFPFRLMWRMFKGIVLAALIGLGFFL